MQPRPSLTYPALSPLPPNPRRTVTYHYDDANRLDWIKQNGAFFAESLTYDDAGRPSGYTTGTVAHTFTYDTAGRTSRIASNAPSGLDLTYGYDNVGNVRTITDPRPGASQQFTLDSLDRLATANGPFGSVSWTYDAAGNRLSEVGTTTTSYSYNTATQRLMSSTGASTESFTYDAVGQLRTDGVGTYTYSPAGHLTNVTASGVSVSYAYDGAGVRFGRTVNGATAYTLRSPAGTVLTEYGSACGTPTWTRDYVYAGGRLLGAVKSTAAAPTVSVSATGVSVNESAATVSVSFVLTTASALACPVTASYETKNGTAAAGVDLTAKMANVTFPSGSVNGAVQTVTVSLTNDVLDEDDETFFVDLTGVTGGTVGSSARTTVTILDNDSLPAISINDPTVTEGSTGTATLTFTVTLSAPSGRSITVDYATAPNTATGIADYAPVSGTVTFAAGAVTRTVTVAVVGDTWDEPDESLFLNLTNPTNATLADAQGRGVILDDDPTTSPPVLDFNRDGHPDLVWRHAVSGYNALWYLNGVTQTGTTLLLPDVPGGASQLADLNWQIRAVGDFSGDGKPDLIWQNQSNGQLAAWLFDNATRTDTRYLTLLSGQYGDPDTNWKVVGAADMNGDGQLDLMWWNQSTSALRIWHMDGTVQIDAVALAYSANDPQWQIAGIADMNGDHWPDLVWRHYGNGGLATWFMVDAQRLDTQWLSPDTNSDVNWRIVGVTDINGDGQADLVWQHLLNGQLAVWFMTGTTMTGTNYLQPSSVTDVNWRIVGVR